MDSGAVIAIASGGSALGAAVFTTRRADARADKAARAAAEAELRAALGLFLTAADHLQITLSGIPVENRSGRMVARIVDLLPTLRFLVQQLGDWTIGRAGRRALEDYIVASNRLHLVAGEDLLPPLGAVHEFLMALERRGDPDWQEQWTAVRSPFLVAAREAAGPF